MTEMVTVERIIMNQNLKDLVSILIPTYNRPALFEQTAEECVELAHVCMKLARKLRQMVTQLSETGFPHPRRRSY